MADLGGSERPVGTLAEINEMGMNPRGFGSCSMRTPTNKGCAWFSRCRFREFRDQIGGKKGPVNCAIRVVLAPVDGGAANTMVMPCFDYYYSGLYERHKQGDETGEVVKIVAIEGDGKKVRCRITKRAHPKPEPGCLACAEGKCLQRVETIEGAPDGIEVPRFERPATVYAISGEAKLAREEMLASEEAETVAASFAKQEAQRGRDNRPAGNR